ncbi:MAG: hypothetical protein K5888_11860 [Lachnospiraceae bacterium]|nr:hypothetical protein [Lachnospiraceae bacterium]
MEDSLREEIEKSEDPLAKALIMARVGNYIDFGAMNYVDQDEFLCKCDLFTSRFEVPRLTGIFTEEK